MFPYQIHFFSLFICLFRLKSVILNSNMYLKEINMRKIYLLLVLLLSVVSASAQETTMFQSKTFDNIYIGIMGGGALKAVDAEFSDDCNYNAGLRIGREFTPVFGLAVEGDAFFSAKPVEGACMTGTKVKYVNTSLLANVNLMNWFGGYKGKSRRFEISAVYGLGWGHSFNNTSSPSINNLTSRAGANIALNLGEKRAWKIFMEPSVNYLLNGDGYSGIEYNINRAYLQLNAGIAYKFRNSNGTHGFALAELRDQSEITALNDKINSMRRELSERDRMMAEKDHAIAGLQTQLQKAQTELAHYEKHPTVVKKTNTQGVVLQPTVVFSIGSTIVEKPQQANVALVAKYMKDNPDSKIRIIGYTSPDGSDEINQKISLARANAVKDMLVQKYGIAPNRMISVGEGASRQMFDDVELNRIVVFVDITK